MGPAQYISRASSVSLSTIKQSGGKWFAAFSKFFHFSTAFPGSARGNQGSSQVCTLAVWCTGRRFSSCEFASFLHSEPHCRHLSSSQSSCCPCTRSTHQEPATAQPVLPVTTPHSHTVLRPQQTVSTNPHPSLRAAPAGHAGRRDWSPKYGAAS